MAPTTSVGLVGIVNDDSKRCWKGVHIGLIYVANIPEARKSNMTETDTFIRKNLIKVDGYEFENLVQIFT